MSKNLCRSLRGSLTLALALATVMSIAACGGSQSNSSAPSDPSTAPPGESTATPDPSPTPEMAKAYVAEMDAELRRLWTTQAAADWEKSTNITDETTATAAQAGAASMNYLTKAIHASKKFLAIWDELDPETRRQLHLLRMAGTPAPEDPAKAQELATAQATMEGLYGKGKACDDSGKCRDLGELEDVLMTSRKPDELLAAWQGWHMVGRGIKPHYEKFVALANEGARGVGFADLGEQWRSGYDMSPQEFEQETERLWQEVKPLYEQLHCYARRKLVAKYGAKVVPTDGPIPAHLLGNMWAQQWGHIFKLAEPYKGQINPDVTPALKKQGYDHERMVKLAEGFFTSLGLKPLPPTFWERSMFVKPEGREVVCHASAWDLTYAGDVRIKMCIKVNQEDLITVHHELGHNYYYLYYHQLPVLFQSGANDGFHEAIGDAITLSMTPEYMKKVGLLDKVSTSQKALINQQMYTALDKIAFLPWGLLVDKWRWDVFSGKVKPEQYNAHWWDLRKQYQGVAPPVERTAEDFDPGAKYHIPGNTPYMRYFLAFVLQFQFHKALCQAAGHEGPLHTCSIYGSKPAGEKLAAVLSLGASKPWPDALEAMTGQRTMTAAPLVEYFAPLMTWLETENAGKTCGW